MSDALARDQPEVESLDPDQALVTRRNARDERDYRERCAESYGMVELGEEVFHPADILEALAPDAARRGRDEASTQAREDLEQTVCEQFPAPIAVPFHAFLQGSLNPLQQLHRLRDSWESLVRLLAALALSEAARSATPLTPLVVREGTDQGWRECTARDLRTDRLAVRIGLIEGVLYRAEKVGAELKVASLIPVEVIAEVRRLNVVRNGFSHAATKSDAQAKEIINEAYHVMSDVLLDLRDMQSVELLRIQHLQPGGQAAVEKLTGHAQSRSIRVEDLDADVVALATPVDGMSRVLARVDRLILDLSPFLYADDDDTGHRTRVFLYQRKKADEWQMECVADSTTKTSPAAQHEALLVPLETLLRPSGDSA